MPNPRLANRYAQSLIDLSTERGELESVYADMKYVQAVCKASKEFVNLLNSPIINDHQKNSIITAITNGKISELTTLFISLLVKKKRESDLPEIAYAFVDQYNVIKNIQIVKLTTAVAISDELKLSIESKVKTEIGMSSVELEAAVDDKLIGGFVLEFNNNLIDASILRDLKDIKKQFAVNLFTPTSIK